MRQPSRTSIDAYGDGTTTHAHRICPGRYFAENGLFINIASALHVFDITPPVDEKGEVINIVPQMMGGLLTYVPVLVPPP